MKTHRLRTPIFKDVPPSEQPELVPKAQCKNCTYCWSYSGTNRSCDYLLIERKRRPKPVDGKCPVRKPGKKTRVKLDQPF